MGLLVMALMNACCQMRGFLTLMTEPWWSSPWRERFWPAPASFFPDGVMISCATGLAKHAGELL